MTLNEKSTSADIAQHTYTRHMPAPDYVYQDWESGTLARVTPKSRRLWPFVVPLAVMVGLALGVLIERMWL